MILRLDGVVCWCGAWFLVLFCYLIGDSYSSLCQRAKWYMSPCETMISVHWLSCPWNWAELADFGREAVLGGLLTTNQESTSWAMKGTPSFVGGSDQHQPNTCKIFRILKGGWGPRGGLTGMICPHPQAIEHQGRMGAYRRWMSRNGVRRGDCGRVVGRGLAWLAFREISGISP